LKHYKIVFWNEVWTVRRDSLLLTIKGYVGVCYPGRMDFKVRTIWFRCLTKLHLCMDIFASETSVSGCDGEEISEPEKPFNVAETVSNMLQKEDNEASDF